MRAAQSLAKGTTAATCSAGRNRTFCRAWGGAVVAKWNKLPTAVPKTLFEHAVSNTDPRECLDLRELGEPKAHGVS